MIVEGFALSVREREFVSMIGHSGCGKSTVLAMVAGLSSPTAGAITLAGLPIEGPGPDRGVVFQSPCLLPWMTALENVRLGVGQVRPTASRKEQEQIAAEFLSLVGLHDSLQRRVPELSMGMRQRVGLARALALSPRILLLDEPFGMLDTLTRLELQDLLLRIWQQHQITALMVTHDVDEAIFLSDRVVLMTSGPAARVAEIVEVPFSRPRNRLQVLESAQYYPLRERLIEFLERQERKGAAQSPQAGSAGHAAQTPPTQLESAHAVRPSCSKHAAPANPWSFGRSDVT